MRDLNGKDALVVGFLESSPDAQEFFARASAIVEQAVKAYLARGFKDLAVGFGCTGGQHRSIYFAERLAKELAAKFPVRLEVRHLEQEKRDAAKRLTNSAGGPQVS